MKYCVELLFSFSMNNFIWNTILSNCKINKDYVINKTRIMKDSHLYCWKTFLASCVSLFCNWYARILQKVVKQQSWVVEIVITSVFRKDFWYFLYNFKCWYSVEVLMLLVIQTFDNYRYRQTENFITVTLHSAYVGEG